MPDMFQNRSGNDPTCYSFDKLSLYSGQTEGGISDEATTGLALDVISQHDIIAVTMTRILADLPDDDIKWLDSFAAEQGKSRASVLREAVAAYRAETPKDWLEIGFGAWARQGIVIDPHVYERQRRAEWTRPWDDDYEEVRAESPECFTPEDDRERAHYLALTKQAASKRDKNAA